MGEAEKQHGEALTAFVNQNYEQCLTALHKLLKPGAPSRPLPLPIGVPLWSDPNGSATPPSPPPPPLSLRHLPPLRGTLTSVGMAVAVGMRAETSAPLSFGAGRGGGTLSHLVAVARARWPPGAPPVADERRKADPRVQHNVALAEFFKGGCVEVEPGPPTPLPEEQAGGGGEGGGRAGPGGDAPLEGEGRDES